MTDDPRYCVGLGDVIEARKRLAGHIRRTPLVHSEWLSWHCGGPAHLKLETLQVTHSFKARGALNAATVLAEASRDRQGPPVAVVTASAGNHGRAVAWACRQTGLAATVFTPRRAPRSKTDAIRREGADLRDIAADYDEAEQLAQAFAREQGAVFVSPYDHPDVIAGAGTIALELLDDLPDAAVVVVPVGGGGLISGIAAALEALRPSVEIVGVEVEASRAFSAARAAGRIVPIAVGETIADGLGGNVDPDTRTWPFIRDLVDRLVVVGEGDLRRAFSELLAAEHLVAEGAGVAAVAALRAGRMELDGRQAAVLLTGANIDLERIAALIRA